MSEPPHHQNRRPAQPPRGPRDPNRGGPPWQPPAQPQYPQGQYPPARQPQDRYQQDHYPPAQYPPRAEQRPPQREPHRPPARQQAPAPERVREPEHRSRLRLPGLGLLLTLLGTAVQLLSFTLLPWASVGTANPVSLHQIWTSLADGGAQGFGDWYVVLFSYPLAALGVLLAFAAVLESVAMKVVWGGLVLLGLGFLVLRYGLGPLTGLAGGKTGAMQFSTTDIVIALAAVAAIVLVVFALKTAVTMFRRIAGLVLLALSGVHIAAVMDLVKASSLAELSIGAYAPSAGFLLVGVAALIGPRKVVPGL